MKKRFMKILTVLFALLIAFGATACTGTGSTGGNSDAENTLDIYLLYKGYGDAWLTSAI